MTHAKDRTLLASLGFADPDKKEPLHDLACRYLARADVADKGLRAFGAEWSVDRAYCDTRISSSITCPHKAYDHQVTVTRSGTRREKTEFIGAELELPIVKGHGQYRSMVGFIDCLLGYRVTSTVPGANGSHVCRINYGREFGDVTRLPDKDMSLGARLGMVFIEVKIRPSPIGDVMRQIKLYREFTSSYEQLRQIRLYKDFADSDGVTKMADGEMPWVLAVAYDVSVSERQSLLNEGVSVIRLGPGFKKFVDEQGRMGHDAEIPEL